MTDIKWIKENITHAIQVKPFSVVLALGKLLHQGMNAELKPLFFEFLPKHLNEPEIQILWEALDSNAPSSNLMEEETKQSISNLKMTMLVLPSVFLKLSPQAIIQSCSNEQYYRLALCALIRKQSWPLDPYDQYDLISLNNIASEFDNGEIQSIFKMVSLPIDDIISLGSSSHIAKRILLDLSGHEHFFTLSQRFAERHPDLRDFIAQRWESFLRDHPYEAPVRQSALRALVAMQEFPEFSSIEVSSSRSRLIDLNVQASQDLISSLFQKLKWGINTIIDEAYITTNDLVDVLTFRDWKARAPAENREGTILREPSKQTRNII